MTKKIISYGFVFALVIIAFQSGYARAEGRNYNLQCNFKKSLVNDGVLGGVDPNSDGNVYISIEITTSASTGTSPFSTVTTLTLPNKFQTEPAITSSSASLERTKKTLKFIIAGAVRPLVLQRPLRNKTSAAFRISRGELGLSGCASCIMKIAGSCSKVGSNLQ